MIAPTFEDAHAFAAALPGTGALIGLDLGTKTIGVAVSDVTRFIATPLETIRRARFSADYARLDEIMSEREIVGVVIGLPLNMEGSEGPRAQSTRAFVREAAKRGSRPILFWDERLSTAWAEDHLIEQNFSRRARADVIDRVAAGYILQGALDRMREAAGA
jgi:putative Holliday junction resolvase